MTLWRNAGLPILVLGGSMSKKAIFFFDANNWYHNVKSYFNPSEIDIQKVANLLSKIKNYHIQGIRFYASIPSISDGEDMYYRHISFLDNLEKKGVVVVRRKLQKLSNKEILKKKSQIVEELDLCENCRKLVEAEFLNLADIKRKEKGIDVWIAADMVNLSIIENICDVCVLISGDADFVHVLEIIKNKGKEVLTAMTPKGYSRELIEKFPFFIIKKETLMKCLKDYPGKTFQ